MDLVENLKRTARATVASTHDARWQDCLEGRAALEIERLRTALEKYGVHTYECAQSSNGQKCDCGWSEWVKTLNEQNAPCEHHWVAHVENCSKCSKCGSIVKYA